MKVKLKINFNKEVPAPIDDNLVRQATQKIASAEPRIKGELEINIVSPAIIKKLNKQYRGKNSVTDVLSFAWQEDKKVKSDFLGQIYICWARIKTQAKEWEVSEKEEFVRILVHGLLHLVGHDHIKKSEAIKMFALQEAAVKSIL